MPEAKLRPIEPGQGTHPAKAADTPALATAAALALWVEFRFPPPVRGSSGVAATTKTAVTAATACRQRILSPPNLMRQNGLADRFFMPPL
jgi:hypothetical protein